MRALALPIIILLFLAVILVVALSMKMSVTIDSLREETATASTLTQIAFAPTETMLAITEEINLTKTVLWLTPSRTPTPTITYTPSNTLPPTDTFTPTATRTPTPTPTPTSTFTSTPTATATPTITLTPSRTPFPPCRAVLLKDSGGFSMPTSVSQSVSSLEAREVVEVQWQTPDRTWSYIATREQRERQMWISTDNLQIDTSCTLFTNSVGEAFMQDLGWSGQVLLTDDFDEGSSNWNVLEGPAQLRILVNDNNGRSMYIDGIANGGGISVIEPLQEMPSGRERAVALAFHRSDLNSESYVAVRFTSYRGNPTGQGNYYEVQIGNSCDVSVTKKSNNDVQDKYEVLPHVATGICHGTADYVELHLDSTGLLKVFIDAVFIGAVRLEMDDYYDVIQLAVRNTKVELFFATIVEQ